RCRVLDLGTPRGAAAGTAPGATDGAAPRGRAMRILEEIAATGTPDVEVGFPGGRRVVFRPRRAEIEADLAPQTAPDGSWVFLITGGARGITAEAALGIAERFKPTLVLVGRSPLPPEREAAVTAGLAGMPEIRAVLLEEMRRGGAAPTPAAVEAAAKRLLQEREMRGCLGALRATGARVTYVRADVRDAAALGAVVAGVYRDHGRLDAVIHGAGIIEDKKFEDKTAESFDRVFGTKVDGALALARAVRPEGLRLLAFFSSVAGRYGNRGQCDYAAANDAVNKLAADLDRRWPARVVSLNWGPWMKTGMASPEVQRQFRERGIALVPPDGGRRAFVQEIERGAKGDVEVVLGDGPWRPFAEAAEAAVAAAPRTAEAAVPRPAIAALHEELPLLNGARLQATAGGVVELTRLFDPAHDLYLLDHRLDGRPVLPLAVAMELAAEVVRRGWPDMEIAALLDFRLLHGVVLENGPRAVRVQARPAQQPDQESLGLAVDVTILDPERGRPFYQGTVLLADRLPEPPARHLAPLRDARPFPMSLPDAYAEWLFHGPLFRGITSVEGIDDDGISGTVEPSQPGRCVRDAGGTEWIIDPVVVDSAFQLGILHSRARFDMTPLPARLRSFRRFAPLAGGPIRCEYRSVPRAGGHVLDIQIAFHDAGGRLLGLLEDMELSCSRELNRLAVKTRGEA
ncbi:MAG: SDR family NAD(P)-dependent oxidoreductase, partial [Candidatus Polarisedimenticolia bacterium]